MKVCFPALLFPLFLVGQSHPTWWTYASPDSTALVGIHWSAVAATPFAEAVIAELGPEGLGLPQLDCLLRSDQILISSPTLLALASGTFPPEAVGQQARELGMVQGSYKGYALWLSPGKDGMGVGQFSNQILLVGGRRAVEEALDRARSSLPQPSEESREATAAKATQPRRYSPLLARAARFNGTTDLWVVSQRLPDELASRFVPFMVEARGFEGGVSMANGLQVDASVFAGSRMAAVALEDRLIDSLNGLPPLLRNAETRVEEDHVVLTVTVTQDQFNASLRGSKPVEIAQQEALPPVLPTPPVLPSTPQAAPAVAMIVQQVPPPPPQMPDVPKGPRVIRIVGLDDGPREIPYNPPGKSN